MLQIRLKRDPFSEGAGAGKPSPTETVTVACPDHLILADLPVGKGLGIESSTSIVKVVGRKSRRQLGERVHFCVRCDFPIAIYGRLSPCDHAFCLDCARSDSICYLCDERIQKIQTIKMMEGIFVCAAPHCLKSFMQKGEFESHIHETHFDLVHPNAEKDDGNESESRKQSSTIPESTARAPSRLPPGFSPVQHDREDNKFRQRPMMQQQKSPTEAALWDPPPPLLHHQVPQQTFMMPNPMLTAPPLPFGFPPFQQPDGAQPFYNAPTEPGPEQGSLLGFPPGGMNFTGNYPQPWNPTGGGGFEQQGIGQEVVVHGSGPSMDLRTQSPSVAASSHMPQMNRGKFYQQSDRGQGFGWQHENQD